MSFNDDFSILFNPIDKGSLSPEEKAEKLTFMKNALVELKGVIQQAEAMVQENSHYTSYKGKVEAAKGAYQKLKTLIDSL